jgi:hypothetical protein
MVSIFLYFLTLTTYWKLSTNQWPLCKFPRTLNSSLYTKFYLCCFKMNHEVGSSSSSPPYYLMITHLSSRLIMLLKIYPSEVIEKIKNFMTWKFQNAWISWAEYIVNDNDEIHQMCSMICKLVEGKEKVLALKLNSVLKYAHKLKCKVFMFWVDVGFYYVNKNLVHSKNEHQYIASYQPFILDLF